MRGHGSGSSIKMCYPDISPKISVRGGGPEKNFQQNIVQTNLVSIEPLDDLITFIDNLLLVIFADLVLEFLILHGGFHVESVALQVVLGGDLLTLLFILSFVFLGVVNHALDFFLG